MPETQEIVNVSFMVIFFFLSFLLLIQENYFEGVDALEEGPILFDLQCRDLSLPHMATCFP